MKIRMCIFKSPFWKFASGITVDLISAVLDNSWDFPVLMHITSSMHHYKYCVGLGSLQIQNSNNADVLLDSELKLSDIIDIILCSK